MKTADLSRKNFVLLFTDKTTLRLPRLLKRGFRHCKIIVESKGGWIFVNPLAEELESYKLPAASLENICEVYTEIGFTVIWGMTSGVRSRDHPSSCVAVAKRLIGVSNRWTKTPHQLYQFLLRQKIAVRA